MKRGGECKGNVREDMAPQMLDLQQYHAGKRQPKKTGKETTGIEWKGQERRRGMQRKCKERTLRHKC